MQFDYFVVFAEMRTGSNFLESNINSFDGLWCHGEAFNPHFIGYPDVPDVLGVTRAVREENPQRLIDAIKTKSDGLGGFRFFNDHDPRALDICLPDPRCAKIILNRNPVDSYVSRKIAHATGQWKLTNVKHARSETVTFDAAEFEAHLEAVQTFQVTLMNALQRTGQTAFYIDYDDLQDVAVMNGLAAFLGCAGRIEALDSNLKKQNPSPIETKVRNFPQMEAALARLDRFNLSRTPNFEPRRGPVVPAFYAAPESPLLYLTVRSGPEDVVREWLSGLDGGAPIRERFTQQTLRQWKAARPGHRSFTVLRHPLARVHAAFCDRILPTGPGAFTEIRNNLRRFYKVPIPKDEPGDEYDAARHRAAFLAFMGFLKVNLAGQTGIRVDAAWSSQTAILQGYATLLLPDMILREDRLEEELAILAAQVGKELMPVVPEVTDRHAERLATIYDPELEALARAVYQRDYLSFGFANWA